MAKKSAPCCIEDNDFYSAKERFDDTTKQWKPYWFRTCYKIAQKNPEILENYVFIEEEYQIIYVEVVKRRKIAKTVEEQTIIKCDSEIKSHTYLIDIIDNEDCRVFTKVGKANVVETRLNQIISKGYSGVNISKTDLLKVYEMPSEDLAEGFESLIKHYIKTCKAVNYYPRDRFSPFDFTDNDYKKIEEIRKAIIALF